MSQGNYIMYTNYTRTIINVFYLIIMVIGVVGNAMVITVILKVKDMRNSTNIYLANLAIIDLVFLLLNTPKELFTINGEKDMYALSQGLCVTWPFLLHTMIHTSVMTILAIGVERYYAVCVPFKAGYICTNQRAYRICLLSWVVGVLTSCPNFLLRYYQQEQLLEGTYSKPACLLRDDSLWKKHYIIFITTAFCFLPLIILLVLFSIIAWHLNKVGTSNENVAAVRHRRHVVTMLATVALIFFSCHLPFRVIQVFSYLFPTPEFRNWRMVNRNSNIWFVAILMLMVHSVVNPILYNFMSTRFRACFKLVFYDIAHGLKSWRTSWCFCKETAIPAHSSSNSGQVSNR